MILKGDKWDSVFETLRTSPVLNATDAGRDVALSGLITSSVEAIYQAMSSGWTMMLGYSSGKDSESLLHLFLMALVRVVRSGEITSRNHFILHTDTGIENPEVHWLAQKKLAALQRFIDDEKLPLTIVLAKPGITSSWTGRILTGRGLPTFANSSVRQCSNDLKINAAQRAKNAFLEGKRLKGRVCLMLGSRDAESSTRAGNIAKKKGRADTVVKNVMVASYILSKTGWRQMSGSSCFPVAQVLSIRCRVIWRITTKRRRCTAPRPGNVSGRLLISDRMRPVVRVLAVRYVRLLDWINQWKHC